MITLPWGEGEVREVLTMLNGSSQNQRVLIASIPVDSAWEIDATLRGDFTKRAEWLESLAQDLIRSLTTTEREDDLGAAQLAVRADGSAG